MKFRSHRNEQLDNLNLNGHILFNTLKSLQFINFYFGNRKQLLTTVLKLCKKSFSNSTVHILDLGCGGGDLIISLFKLFQQKKISSKFTGIDGNQHSIAYASQQKKTAPINFITADILNSNFKVPKCDILISSHFIYHFKDSELISFINQLHHSSVKTIVLSELRRNIFSLYLFKYTRHLLPISKMAKKDGILALQRAFTIQELDHILQHCNVTNYIIKRKPWFRMIAIITI